MRPAGVSRATINPKFTSARKEEGEEGKKKKRNNKKRRAFERFSRTNSLGGSVERSDEDKPTGETM